ncbi:MAG: hypothetical protein M3546_06485 [Actinomycetota bacterium]|nr:hypothetical protein [Actinomycetota bacterium]
MHHTMSSYDGGDGVLITRAEADRARGDIERGIAAQRGDYIVVLDFKGVRAISVPFADSCLGRLLGSRAAGYYDEYPMVVVNATEEVRETIDAALRLRHLYVLALSEGRPDLLGGETILQQTMEKADELREFTVAELSKVLNVSPQAANNRLHALVRAGALARERRPPERGGKQFVYRLPETDAA